MRRLVVLNQVIVLLGSMIQLLAATRSKPLTRRDVAEAMLSWSLPLNLGVLETYLFAWHVLRGGRADEGANQPAADRVRAELAVAHLAFGVLGLLAVRFRGMFWFATVIGQAVFLGGVAAVNAREIWKDKMYLFDVLMSLAHVILLKEYDPLAPRPRRVRQRWFNA